MSQGGRHYIFATAQQERPTKPAELSPISSRRHLSFDPLHRAAAHTDHSGHLEDAMTGAKLLADGCLDLPTDRRASELLDPLLADPVQPGDDPRRIISRSSSPKTQAIWIMALPNGLVLSMACWSLYRATPAASSSAIALATCRTLLPSRSIDQHMHTSNRPRTASLSIWLNAGRCLAPWRR